VTRFDGDLDAYERLVLERARAVRREKGRARRDAGEGDKPAKASRPRGVNTGALRKRLSSLEKQMAETEEKISVFDKALDGGKLYAEDARKAARFAAARAQLARELEQLEEQWLQVSDELEAAENA